MIGNDPLFIDLDKGRVGTFCNTDMKANKRVVVYTPFNSVKRVTITGLSETSLIPIAREWADYPGTSPMYYILISGENDSSIILRDKLNSEVPNLITQINEARRREELRRSAYDTQKRIHERGAESVIKDEMRKQKMMGPSTRRPEENKGRRRFFGGDANE